MHCAQWDLKKLHANAKSCTPTPAGAVRACYFSMSFVSGWNKSGWCEMMLECKHRPAMQSGGFLPSVFSEARGSSLAKNKTGGLYVICAVSLLLTGLIQITAGCCFLTLVKRSSEQNGNKTNGLLCLHMPI